MPQDVQIEFLGESFDFIVNLFHRSKSEKILSWIADVIDKKIQPITIGEKRLYKQWTMNQLLVFRHAFSLNTQEYRILLVKVKNSLFIEFHLGSHK